MCSDIFLPRGMPEHSMSAIKLEIAEHFYIVVDNGHVP